MVKRAKVGGGKRYAAKNRTKKEEENQVENKIPYTPSHLKKKVGKKISFLNKVEASHKALAAAKAGIKKDKKKTLHNLKTLGAALQEIEKSHVTDQVQKVEVKSEKQKPNVKTEKVKSSKQRQNLVASECGRLSAVLNHPLYKKNPFQALTNHLKSQFK
uniref:Ribosome biogenesis protein SLX9 n=1 Tax=Polytomella parva TaxID=51329 RepID=A0A7S0V9I4_9CHLO|mmetsp:Transcript_30778/g.56020  ORF Transcript_30778/g.56020 Transcript_30778/m.56020 type:complete len:159 (+) Transcript_30778:89-565(+)|eukprot:CAMPEP_0175055858 /NCGR_PEP_ID=MMETSP0052_2-20121109/10326_1 /TAXON_ID=51329 ORGANISM="Polytomella parva, Strain SAG 63-3" /NCGR_SAMPLE_ID=MMETSP0052_2 /ASSEMBLY_ACC=CAM_ASM_000194 /LENGTH=158 /DNA_ID=CAMNT_0016320775 /DNA_START=78 /DNA_END=554 /DNA_ORIENTATION=+